MTGFREGQPLPDSNLGINDLLAELVRTVDTSDPKTSSSTKTIDIAIGVASRAVPASRTAQTYLEFYEQKQIVVLGAAVETELANHPDNPEVNLWWVLTQVEIKTIPNSILASTLDNVCENFTKLTEGKFFDWIDLRVLEAPSQMGNSDTLGRLKFLFTAVLTQMQKILASGSEVELSKHFASKLQEFGLNDTKPKEEPSQSNSQTQLQLAVVSVPKKSNSKRLAAGFGVFAVLAAVIILYLYMTPSATQAKFSTIAYNEMAVEDKRVSIPTSLRLESSSLDTILYAIRKPVETASPQASLKSLSAVASVANEIKAQNSLEVVDTSGPLEGTVFNPPPVERHPPPPQTLEREKLASSNAGNIPSSFPGSAVSVDSDRDRDRVPLNSARRPGERDPRDRGGDIFRVVRRTEVMDRPSYRARVASVLAEGARVEVIGHIGIWLKLRSKNGDIGYLDDRDADPIR